MRAPFTAEEIVKRVAGARVGRATVFRTLDLLVEIGALARIHGIEDGGRCVRYAVCAPAHHHHLVCRSCGRLDEVDLSSIDSKLSRLARARGYSAVAHTVEIAGICGSCQAGRA